MSVSFTQKARRRIQEILGVDLRSLALLRIATGTILLSDLFIRGSYLEAHYTDFGLAPRPVLITELSSAYTFSFHLMSGQWWVMAGLFLINAVAAFLFLIGWRTRVMTFVCWCFLMSLQNRNTLILQGGDVLLRLLLFWGLFMPLGARCSVDALRGRVFRGRGITGWDPNLYVSAASAALVLQVVLLYLTAAVHKSSPAWHHDLNAVYLVLAADHFATALGRWMLQFGEALPIMTRMTIYAEWGLPVVLLVPFFFQQLRTAAVIALMLMHICFALFLEIGLFWAIDCAALCGLLPRVFWTAAGRTLSPERRAAAQARFERIVEAAARAGEKAASASLAKMRYVMLNLGAFAALVYVIFWLLPNYEISTLRIPQSLVPIGKFLGLDQRWKMFSPQPFDDDGWWVIEGTLRDGSSLDLMREQRGQIDWSKPEVVSARYPNDRWRKYFRVLLRQPGKTVRREFGRSLCRKFNRGVPPGKQLLSFRMWYMLERTTAEGEAPAKKLLKWRHYCFEVPKEEKALEGKEVKEGEG